MTSCLAFASSCISKYNVFITTRDPKGCVTAYLKNRLRDAEITAFVEDEVGYSVLWTLSKSRLFMVVFTPDFLEHDMCLGVVSRIKRWRDSLLFLPIYCGVSQEEVHEKMMALSQIFDLSGVASLPGFKLSFDSE